MTQPAPPEQWSHVEGLVPIDADPLGEDPHTTEGRACFGCWCYSCGGRTDQPRIRIAADLTVRDDRTDAEIAALGPESPDSHRWCYE